MSFRPALFVAVVSLYVVAGCSAQPQPHTDPDPGPDPSAGTCTIIVTSPHTFAGIGETVPLTAALQGECDTTGKPLTWTSKTPEFATVDASTGVMTALRAGQAVMVAGWAGGSGEFALEIADFEVTQLTPELAADVPAALGTRVATYVTTLGVAGPGETVSAPKGDFPTAVMAVDADGEMLLVYYGPADGRVELSITSTAVALVRFVLSEPVIAPEHVALAWSRIEESPAFSALEQAVRTAAEAGQGPSESEDVAARARDVVAQVAGTLPSNRMVKAQKLPVTVQNGTGTDLLVINRSFIALSASGPVENEVLLSPRAFSITDPLAGPSETKVAGLAMNEMKMALGQSTRTRLINVSGFMGDILTAGTKLTGIPLNSNNDRCTREIIDATLDPATVATISSSPSFGDAAKSSSQLLIDSSLVLSQAWLTRCAPVFKVRVVAVFLFKNVFGWVSKIVEAVKLVEAGMRTRDLFKYWAVTEELTFCRGDSGLLGPCGSCTPEERVALTAEVTTGTWTVTNPEGGTSYTMTLFADGKGEIDAGGSKYPMQWKLAGWDEPLPSYWSTSSSPHKPLGVSPGCIIYDTGFWHPAYSGLVRSNVKSPVTGFNKYKLGGPYGWPMGNYFGHDLSQETPTLVYTKN